MSEEMSTGAKQPIVLSVWFRVSAITSFVLACVTIVGIPFAIIGFVFLAKARGEAQQILESQEQARQHAQGLLAHNAWLQEAIDRLGIMDTVQREELNISLDAQAAAKRAELDVFVSNRMQEIDALGDQIGQASEQVRGLQAQAVDLRAMADLNEFGLFNFENPAEDSVRLGDQLKTTQTAIKEAVKQGNAVKASTTFTLNNSVAKGRKMVGDMSKLLLRAFNAEAENCIKTVRAGRIDVAKKRLERSAAAVERLGKSMDIEITRSYMNLRLSELDVTYQHLQALQAAKEEERAERERIREEEAARRELQAAKAKQEKEVEHYRTVLAALELAGDMAEANKIAGLLSDAEDKLADVESTMANIRAGYVYIISNLGSFGPGMIKIGMTRRLNPDDRVRELGDASVPFLFDKHAMIFSKDAVGLETTLHQHFADRRVNLVNMRREYFYATPAEVKQALLAHDVQLLEYHEPADAPEFTTSKQVREQRGNLTAALVG